ncbi:MAG: TIGR03564 family F420-dependent LLM class oxidoreductase [Myxococcota bacterium]|jgi:F420-dependent oxidoreductase-like protein
MKIGWNGGGHFRSVEAIRERARWAAEHGFASFWLSQIAGPDSLTALAAVGRDAPGLELGTSVVPLYGRHPFVLASQALATQEAVGGRLVLGIGPSHKRYAEHMLGGSYARPFTRTREELQVLQQLLAGKAVDFEGEEVTLRGQLAIEAPAPPILVAALGEKMLALAGSEADGTALWMVGPKTLSDHITPRIRSAAAEAGRPAPRILAGVPVCLTDDAPRARRHAAPQLAVYGMLPAYRAMLEREGAAAPEALLVAGSEDAIRERLAGYKEGGATDLRVSEMCPDEDEAEATRDLLVRLASESN